MKSLTLDDVFTDYYNNHNKISADFQGDNKISKFDILYTFTDIGVYKRKTKKNIIDNLKIKHYIPFGAECSICYENIFHRKNAFLTDCGHCFHYSCIINYDYFESFNNIGIFCPICRQDMGDYNNIKNNFDKYDICNKNPKICFNYYSFSYLNHFHRMNFLNCPYCQI